MLCSIFKKSITLVKNSNEKMSLFFTSVFLAGYQQNTTRKIECIFLKCNIFSLNPQKLVEIQCWVSDVLGYTCERKFLLYS